MTAVSEIRVATGSRKKGSCAARFTLEKGSSSTFAHTTDEFYRTLERRALVIRAPQKIARMERAFNP